MDSVIFNKTFKVCHGLYVYSIPAGTVAKVVRRLGADAAEVTCKNNCGEQVQFVQIFIGNKMFSDCEFMRTT